MTTLTDSTSGTQSTAQIDYYQVNQLLALNIDTVLNYFNIDYITYPNRIACSCPVHQSSRPESLTLYTSGKKSFGNFRCWTHHCEDDIGSGAFNLVKYLLGKHNGNEASREDTLAFVEQITGSKCERISAENIERKTFIYAASKVINDLPEVPTNITRDYVRSRLAGDFGYFVKRGYLPQTMTDFDVDTCYNSKKEMYMRVVVPVYDMSGKYMVGCTGRSVYEECPMCGFYHDPNSMCPSGRYEEKNCTKWRHSNTLKSGQVLYNLWNAASVATAKQKLILVEGPGDVWKLYESGIKNVVGLFGCQLTDMHFNLLEQLGLTDIFLALDNDDSGRTGVGRISEKLQNYYNVHVVDYPTHDIGELKAEEIHKFFGDAV